MAAFGALALGGLYTLIISPLVFAVIIGVIIVSTFFFRLTQRQSHLALTQTSERQTAFFSLFRHLIDGFKEVKLHNPRGESIEHEHLDPASAELRDSQIFAAVQINRGVSVSYFFFYLMLATIAFVLPPFVGEHGIIVQSLYVAIFMLSVVEIILKAVPIITPRELRHRRAQCCRAIPARSREQRACAHLRGRVRADRSPGPDVQLF